jgi:hypothetical protein
LKKQVLLLVQQLIVYPPVDFFAKCRELETDSLGAIAEQKGGRRVLRDESRDL